MQKNRKRCTKFQKFVYYTDEISEREREEGRVSAALGYFCFLIPLMMKEDNSFAMFHCNQSLLLLLLSTVGAFLWMCLPVVGPILAVLQELFCILFMIRGIYLSAKGEAVSIPFLGWITVIAYRYA